ncbi:TIGR04165 family Cys-rich peptide [Methanobacterium alkalithermotolerans]|uniref:TIGR04165 family Cys-rich peptide n=1 Tax=Methanobacterium alkalithermotolerans TaxID=2731220 RepID=A0A8T8K3G8_9EURY|nr:TIGR04165 family Cys-rich peptide [Methanobacterium alkalithermotolerans]QUH22527.1 TIGR04165 family Cys-rich peptide [Methanobacterium alkalithermotolerans]RJS49452.1 MAG: TIGR04165 family Cys-rich peptide [Methanobacterium sp.]
MKFEELNKKCPECGCQDKNISHKRNPESSEDAFYIPHIPQGSVGVIRCSGCGHLYEYCTNSKMPVEIKKLEI